MGMDRSDRRRVRSVGTRDHDESLRDERWKGGYDDSEAKHRSKEKSRSSQREDKDHKSRDRERSKISDVSKKRERESNDDSRNQRKKDVKDREKDRTWELKNKTNAEGERGVSQQSASELQDSVMRMKEERLKRKSDDASAVLSWVSKSRKLEDKRNAEKEKALHFSKMFEEQDNVTQEVDEDEPPANRHPSRDLAGFKVLDGDKVVERGAVVLTLKDQNILADGDINQEADMLENVEIGEQKRRNEAYKAAKKNIIGVYDKFIEDPGFEKKMLPQYDDTIVNEGITLDEKGNISGEAVKTLEELRRRRDDASVTPHFEDLTSTGKDSTDYYTSDEMLKFKKPKKKKSLRKKEKLDIDALEAEARSAGLDSGDHGSRSDGKHQAQKEEHERSVAEKRNNAFQSAYTKADEACKALRMEPTATVQKEQEEEEFVFGADDDDLHKSLQRARKLALKMKDGTPTGPHTIALLATSTSKNVDAENGDSQENQIVFTEMEEFVWGLQLDEEAHNPDAEDVAPAATSEQEQKSKVGGWAEVKDVIHDVKMAEKEVKPDEMIHESSLGKGLSGALQLLKDRGTLKDTVELDGRNMDKKKCKLVGIVNENDDQKEIRIERTDEYGRTLTHMEYYRQFSLKFHGIFPGKKKLENRRRQHDEELKVKQMNNTDTPSESSKRMREALSKNQTPYIVLSGHIKPGKKSDRGPANDGKGKKR